MNGSSADKDDRIIGLHVGSRVFYCHRSTLAHAEAGSYFARRFGVDRNFADDVAYTDSNNISIFFIERDGDLFAHVLKYLTRLTLNLPPYNDENKHLWEDLREEADFFSLDGLSDILSATHRFPYVNEKNYINSQGIMYWLGTGRGKKEHPEYINPLKLRGLGDNRDTSLLEVSVGFFDYQNNFFQDHSDTTVAWNLLQHRKKTDLNSAILEPIGGSTSLWFRPALQPHFPVPLGMAVQDDRPPAPRVLMFGSILVRPTHISLRVPYGIVADEAAAKSSGIFNINLNASLDGEFWETLELELIKVGEAMKVKAMDKEIESIFSAPQAPLLQSTNRLIEVAETFLRRTWKVNGSPQFYKSFCVVGKRGEETDLSGVGLELYGDVQDLS